MDDLTAKDFSDANQRRLDLIARKYGDGLTDAEHTELRALTTRVDEYLRREHPLDASRPNRLIEKMDKIGVHCE